MWKWHLRKFSYLQKWKWWACQKTSHFQLMVKFYEVLSFFFPQKWKNSIWCFLKSAHVLDIFFKCACVYGHVFVSSENKKVLIFLTRQQWNLWNLCCIRIIIIFNINVKWIGPMDSNSVFPPPLFFLFLMSSKQGVHF